MPPHQPPRTSLCLFCSVAAARPRPRQSLAVSVSLTQFVYRSTASARKSTRGKDLEYRIQRADNARTHLLGKNSFDPQNKSARVPSSVYAALRQLREELSDPVFLEASRLPKDTFDERWRDFERIAIAWAKRGDGEKLIAQAQRGRMGGLKKRLRYWFYAEMFGDRFTEAERKNQVEKADLRYPSEWYPATRQLSRTVHLHVGPTNSGKTYHALKRLEQAGRGLYLGPLRLLAHEVFTRLNSKGIPCALVTGEETRMPDEEPKMWSCTVEMAPINTKLDVAVIDEIQMINHADRGWAWTQAFMGVQAKEVHLCGEARAVPLIKELCALTGDTVEVHDYERLTPLEVAPEPLGSLDRLEKGDCIVVFSVLGIHALRREVEKKTGRKCAMVYGSLPPETRAQQARLFNDPDNDYDFLVASDAVGMGLNLAIKRVIFESTVKSNGSFMVPLEISEIKQIAGRAGRYKTAHEANVAATAQRSEVINNNATAPAIREPEVSKTVGLVTTLEKLDFTYLKSAMSKEPLPIATAGLFPPSLIVERFAQYFPSGTPFSYIMLRLHEISKTHPRFHLCSLRDQLAIADAIHTIQNLGISERYTICAVPSNMRNETEAAFLVSLVQRIAEGKTVGILDIPELPLDILDERMSSATSYLRNLETLHKCIVVYLWLSYRFPNSVVSRKLANYTKQLTEDAIERTLTTFTYTDYASLHRHNQKKAAMRRLGSLDASAETGADVDESSAKELGLPEAVQDVLKDDTLLAEPAPRPDDESELPADDTEILEADAANVNEHENENEKRSSSATAA